MLCIHGEVVDPSVDFFEREQLFIADKLEPILEQVPNLKVVSRARDDEGGGGVC